MERDPQRGLEALRRGIELGPDHVDTAELYGAGAVEHAAVPFCQRHVIAAVRYGPFAAGAFPDGRTTAGGRALAEVASTHAATPRQVALAFLTRPMA